MILITGSTGYIGSHISDFFDKKNKLHWYRQLFILLQAKCSNKKKHLKVIYLIIKKSKNHKEIQY